MNNEERVPPNAVILEIKDTDFIAGGETRVDAPILKADGQYDMYLPDEETQYDFKFDTYACVSFSGLNIIETILNYKKATGKISQENKDWLLANGYIDYRTNKINFSDRFTAKMSRTGKNGNSLGNVGDSIRNHGLIPESLWKFPDTMNESMTNEQKWNIYYAEIPENLKALGLEFKRRFDVQYQWVLTGGIQQDWATEILTHMLQFGPIQIAAAVCTPWNSTEGMPPIKACGCSTQHATILYGYNKGSSLKDFDHYRSFRKLLAWDYCIQYAMQYYVKEKDLKSVTVPMRDIAFGEGATSEVLNLQKCLQSLISISTGKPYMMIGVFGPFGPQTRNALALFQKDHGIETNTPGVNFGPKTRAKMLELINK